MSDGNLHWLSGGGMCEGGRDSAAAWRAAAGSLLVAPRRRADRARRRPAVCPRCPLLPPRFEWFGPAFMARNYSVLFFDGPGQGLTARTEPFMPFYPAVRGWPRWGRRGGHAVAAQALLRPALTRPPTISRQNRQRSTWRQCLMQP